MYVHAYIHIRMHEHNNQINSIFIPIDLHQLIII